MALPAQDFDIRQEEASKRPGAFDENMGDIEEIIGMDRILGLGLAPSYALEAISEECCAFQ
jgi:hypothetical protein